MCCLSIAGHEWEPAVSRIWEALKEAEKDKARANSRARAAAPAKDGADRRKSTRWEQPVPVLVYGSDEHKQPFHEETETLDINEDGCAIPLETPVIRGQVLYLTNMRNQAERECRVVHIGKRSKGKCRVGINFLRPGTNPELPGHSPDFWQNS
jgi:PilZ domain-containing protein